MRQKVASGRLFFVPKKEGVRFMEDLKQRMRRYWTRRAPDFSALRLQEIQGDKHILWMEELKRYIPMDRRLRILDLGTGTGFLALLLASQGHRVSGIDMTPEMIVHAQSTAALLNLKADFQVMDAEAPGFAPETFDVLVSRNLTWGLPHLERAYKAWHSLLKPGGILVNFDGDYCREQPPKKLPAHHAHQSLSQELMGQYEQLKQELRPEQEPRPQWDMLLLKEAGFRSIKIDEGLWQRIYSVPDQFYNPTPMFAISACA